MNPQKNRILGLGTVGSARNVLARNREEITRRAGRESRSCKPRARFKKPRACPHGRHRAVSDPYEIVA